MNTTHPPPALCPHPMSQRDAGSFLADVRRSGFDLRRTVFLTIVVGFGDRPDLAFTMLHAEQQPGWHAALYGDDSGWLVRLGHACRLTPDVLCSCLDEVTALAGSCGGSIREVTIEDLRADDCWAAIAGQLLEADRPRLHTMRSQTA